MDLPPASDPRWEDIVSGKMTHEFSFFPLKLLLARQRLQVVTNPGPETTRTCVEELHTMIEKNKHLPRVQDDLSKIFGEQPSFWKRLFKRGRK